MGCKSNEFDIEKWRYHISCMYCRQETKFNNSLRLVASCPDLGLGVYGYRLRAIQTQRLGQ